MGNIEEDIKQLESLILDGESFIIGEKEHDEIYLKDIKAINSLINNYTRQKQINEEHKKINGELREKVKELEEENKENKKKYLALLIGQFPDTTETYKKYKKELQKLLQESEDK